MKAIAGFWILAIGLVCVEAGSVSAQYYRQMCRPNYLSGGYICSDSNGYDVRVRPSMGINGGSKSRIIRGIGAVDIKI